MIPKVKFEVAPLDHYLRHIHFFLNPQEAGFDWSKSVLRKYPLLTKKLKDVKDREKRMEITDQFFKETEKDKHGKMQKQKEQFQKSWDKINKKIMESLSNIAEIEWSKKDMKITAFLTLNPICPRYLKYRSFDVFYDSNIQKMKEICLHEIFHFIYFEKWKRVFPKIDEKEFEAPYLVWLLSEIVPGIALKDSRIQNIFQHNPPIYTSFKTAKINKKPLLGYIQNFYNKKKNFADFLRKSWKFAQENEKEIRQLIFRKS